MNLAVVRAIRRVKNLRADRAEDELRARRAALAAATEAATEAQRALAEWRASMPRRQAAIYDAVIGRVVDTAALDEVKASVVALREHEQVLQDRLAEAQKGVQAAETAMRAAEAASYEARRNLAKFDNLIATLQRSETLLAERREDSELEEAVEGRGPAEDRPAGGFDDDIDGIAGAGYEWDQTAG